MNGIIWSAGNNVLTAAGFAVVVIVGYLLGGINTAIILSKLKYKDDIRNYGSKNAGLTNVLRTYGKGAAAITLLGDILKAILACFIGSVLLGDVGAIIGGSFAVIGHILPVYFKFKGGKGVLTFAAVALYCSPDVFLVVITVFIIIVSFTKYISLGSVMCALLYPLLLYRFGYYTLVIPAFFICVMIIIMHRTNIKRLMNKEENKIHLGKNGGFLPSWLLAIICFVMIAAVVLMLGLKYSYYNGTSERNKDAVTCKDESLSQIQLRILFIDEKNAHFGEAEQNEDSDDMLMSRALERARRIVILKSAALDAGYTVSEEGTAKASSYLAENLSQLYGYVSNDTAETYCRRVYGMGVKAEQDVLELIRSEIYAEEYAELIGNEAADSLLNGADTEYKVDVNKNAEKAVTDKY